MPADLTQEILNSNVITGLIRSVINPELISDTAANDNDKSITVPSGQIWHILWVWLNLSTSADAGGRNMRFALRDDSDNIIYEIRASNSQVESTTETYIWSPNFPEPDEYLAGWHTGGIPPHCYLPAGHEIRIYDASDQSPSGDDLTIRVMVNRFDI